MRCTEATFNHSLDFFAVIYDGDWTERRWSDRNKKLKQKPEDYAHLGLYSPDNGETRDMDHYFVPCKLLPVLQLLMNGANNLTILCHFIDSLRERPAESERQATRVLGRILEQVVQFIGCACQAAWEIGQISPDFVPYDLYQFLDIYHKVGVLDREVIKRLGYQDRYEVVWDESLRRCPTILSLHRLIYYVGGQPDLGMKHPIVMELAKNPLFKQCYFDVDNADTWDDIYRLEFRSIEAVWAVIKRYLAKVERLRTCEEDDEDIQRLQDSREIIETYVNRSRIDMGKEWVKERMTVSTALERLDARIAAKEHEINTITTKLGDAPEGSSARGKRKRPQRRNPSNTSQANAPPRNRVGGVRTPEPPVGPSAGGGVGNSNEGSPEGDRSPNRKRRRGGLERQREARNEQPTDQQNVPSQGSRDVPTGAHNAPSNPMSSTAATNQDIINGMQGLL